MGKCIKPFRFTGIILLLFLVVCHPCRAQQFPDETVSIMIYGSNTEVQRCYAGFPVSNDLDDPLSVLDKDYFVIGYSEARKNPEWVCFYLGSTWDLNAYKRISFKTDTHTSARVSTSDYTNSGYQRGHMAPRQGISTSYSEEGNDATFTMSNVCPQFGRFNDGQWGDLEEWVAGRKLSNGGFIEGWADYYGGVWVTVGPIFGEDDDFIGPDEDIEVPEAFYCIVLDIIEETGEPNIIAFILDHVNEREKDGPAKYIVSVDDIEERTSLDFFSGMDDSLEEEIESYTAPELWYLENKPH